MLSKVQMYTVGTCELPVDNTLSSAIFYLMWDTFMHVNIRQKRNKTTVTAKPLLQTKLIAFGLFVRGYSSQLSGALETAASLAQLDKRYSAQWEKAGSCGIKSRPDQQRRMSLFWHKWVASSDGDEKPWLRPRLTALSLFWFSWNAKEPTLLFLNKVTKLGM